VKERVLHREQTLEVGIEPAFEFFAKAENLEAITPPWLGFRITSQTPIEMGAGTEIRYRLRLHGIPVRWLTRIDEWDPPADGSGGFVDRQIRGPYALWHHTHRFEALGAGRTLMTDTVRYGHRLGPLGSLAERLIVARDLRRIFDYRRDSIADLITTEQGAVPA
jgi:ligand-binding SRPBCC domain-containing protein